VKTRNLFYRAVTVVTLVAVLSVQTAAIPVRSARADGPITFTKHIIDGNFEGAMFVCATDVDGDGDVDVLGAATYADDIAWWENDGSEHFTKHTIDGNFDGASSVYATDVDGDGDIDVLSAARYADEVAWWENDGSEHFTKQIIDSNFDGTESVYATDVDGDGDVDVLGAATYADDIAWWENDGSEHFTRHTIDGNFDGALSVYATDVDGDGDMDVLGTAYSGDVIAWWENDGSEHFTKQIIAGDFDAARSVYATDVDGDGDVDVLGAADYADEIAWWENDGSEHFTKHTIDGNFDGASSVYAADVDGDGDVDVLGAAGAADKITWWENDGSEHFTKYTIEGNFNGAVSVCATDMDGDGDVDVLGTAEGDDDIIWWESSASGSWPDFEVLFLDWSPDEPEVMEDTRIDVTIQNIGEDYVPVSGKVYIELTLQAENTSDQWFWRFPGEISVVPTNEWKTLRINRFWFTREQINAIQACVSFDDPEANPSNNCLPDPEDITVHAPVAPWRECVMIPIDAVMLGIDAYTGGAARVGASTEAARLFLVHIGSISIACQAYDWTCMTTTARFLIDAAVLLGTELIEGLSPHKWIITLVKDGIFLFQSSYACGDKLGKFVRASIEEARHRGEPVNAVVARSPVYICAVDGSGRRAGFLEDGTVVAEIPDAEIAENNGTKVVLYPGTDTANVEIKGVETGTFDLIVSLSRQDAEVHTVIYESVSVTANTKGEIDVVSGQYTLALDDDGDGTTDRTIQPTEEIRTHIKWLYLPAVMKDS